MTPPASVIFFSACDYHVSYVPDQMRMGILGWPYESGDPAGLDDDRDLRDAALAEQLGVAEGQQVDDGDGVLLLALEVGGALLSRDEGPKLVQVDNGLPEVAVNG